MRFRADRGAFLDLLQTVSPAVASRTTQQVLTGVLIECKEDAVTATAYDLNFGIQARLIETEEAKTDIIREGSAVLPAKQLIDLTRKLTDGEIEIEIDIAIGNEVRAGAVATIRCGQFECGLHLLSGDMFPRLPVVSGVPSVRIDAGLLKDFVKSTAFAASKSESRPVLAGVCMELTPDCVSFSATDSLRLATRKRALETQLSERLMVIIPSDTLVELSRTLSNDATEVAISVTESHCLFQTDSLRFYTRIIEGSFVDVARLIPKTFMTEVVVRTESLIRAIDRAIVIAPRNFEIQLTIQFGTIVVETKSPEFGNLMDVIPTETLQGESISIALNAKNVIEALRSLSSVETVLRMAGPNQPVVLMPKDDESFVHVISPIIMRHRGPQPSQ